MSLQVTTKSNITPYVGLKQVSSINFKGESSDNEQNQPPKRSNKLKYGVLLTTLAGVSTALAIMLKTKGYSLNPAKIFTKSPKEWGIFNAVYDGEKHEVEKLVGGLAVGSVAGGLVGGKLFDKKENMKAKYRESIIQLVGNVATPLACVSLGMRGFKKIEPKVLKWLQGSRTKPLNNVVKGIPSVLATTASLIGGILLGNKVGNTINKNVFKCDDNRKIKVADMSPHIDDLCLSLSLVAAQSKIGPYVTRVIPAALMVAGFSTGIAQEKPLFIPNQSEKCK